jgi:hypothetical protein
VLLFLVAELNGLLRCYNRFLKPINLKIRLFI